MTEIDQRSVQELLDREAVRVLFARYAAGVDRRDSDLLRKCFTHDVTFVVSGEARLDAGSADPLVVGPGREDVITFFAATARQFRIGTHFSGPSIIELEGDRGTAETYSISFAIRPASDTVAVRGVRYLDELSRDGQEWRIRTRLLTLDWAANAPIEFAQEFESRVGRLEVPSDRRT